jgi:L-asparaginase II
MVVEVTRGDLVESVHHLAGCVTGANGEVIFGTGDVESPVFLRSAAKPFIAAAAIAAGVREAFDLDMREIAVMCASHVGEPFHIDAVRSILKKIGLDESALQCGAHYPYDEASAHALIERHEAPSALHNNCSGKHAGILALAKVLGADTSTYLSIDNAAERAILAFCARMSDDDPAAWPIGIDGCGIPVYATGLRKAAMAFARFATLSHVPPRDAMALLVVRDAMISHPKYVAGTAQFDTLLMQAAGGAIACKSGAEGVHGVALMPQGLGFVGKVLDGTSRARAPFTMDVLRRLRTQAGDAPKMGGFARPVVYNRAGLAVGEIRVSEGTN